MQKNTNQKLTHNFFLVIKDMFKSLSLSLSLSLNLSVLYWHDKTIHLLPKQLQLGCSQVVHIWINRNKNKNNNSNKTNI